MLFRSFDAIIANPPYIKQERISNKGELSKLLTAFATLENQKRIEQRDYNLPPNPIQKIQFELTGKTDLYGYFLWHSTFFLKEHGILCFIIPNKWMDVQYGEKVKEFLLNHYRIDSLISFSQNQFEFAQVSTIIIFAFRESNKIKRENQIVRFYQFDQNDRIDDFVAEILTKPYNAISGALANGQYLFERSADHYTCTYVRQENLDTSEKWSFKYLFQSHLSRLLDGAPLISMDNGEITRVVGGIKTGANEFFFPNPAEIKSYKIEQEFLKPGIKSGRNIPNETIVREGADLFLSIPPKTNLNEYQGLKEYIIQCETEKKYHERPSVNWRPWYAIPEERQDSPDILFLRHIDANFQAKWNQIGCVVADGVRGITILDKSHIKFYLGVCNSIFFYWMAHIQGRWEGQGDLQLLVYELRKFLIPDLRKIPITKIQTVENAIDMIIEYEQTDRIEKAPRKKCINDHRHQEELDMAVLDCLNLSEYYNLLKSELTALETMRLNKNQ